MIMIAESTFNHPGSSIRKPSTDCYTQLLAIKIGPGAALLPKNVQRIHMDFGVKIDGGNRGPKSVPPSLSAHPNQACTHIN
jgi:hypothetical protein